MLLQPRLGVVGITPHVRHKGALRHFNATTTEPTAQGLVDVFPTPGDHVVIVATSLLEMTMGIRRKLQDTQNVACLQPQSNSFTFWRIETFNCKESVVDLQKTLLG